MNDILTQPIKEPLVEGLDEKLKEELKEQLQRGNSEFMREAVKEAYVGINHHHGGPFGSVIVRDGMIVGRGHNRVLVNKDCTCHGEMEAIRDACKRLGTHDLSGCELYTTAEPCPMCLGAILWSNIRRVFYGCNRKDTDSIGFRDDEFYACFYGEKDIFCMTECDREACLQLFSEYQADEGHKRY